MKAFNQIEVPYMFRSCNSIAHSLVKLTLEKYENVAWTGSYPYAHIRFIDLMEFSFIPLRRKKHYHPS